MAPLRLRMRSPTPASPQSWAPPAVTPSTTFSAPQLTRRRHGAAVATKLATQGRALILNHSNTASSAATANWRPRPTGGYVRHRATAGRVRRHGHLGRAGGGGRGRSGGADRHHQQRGGDRAPGAGRRDAGQTVYGGTKAALDAMTRAWARELTMRATVNAVNAGPIITKDVCACPPPARLPRRAECVQTAGSSSVVRHFRSTYLSS